MLASNTKGLKALHLLLVKARFLALEGADSKKLADILDWAEILPNYICDPEDRTVEFEDMIIGLGEKHSEFSGLINSYHEGRIP